MFDKEKFVNAASTAPLSTTVQQCPEGEYTAMIATGDAIDWIDPNGAIESKKNPGEVFHTIRIPIEILDDAVRAQLKRDKVTVNYDSFLDVDDSGLPDFSEGRNVGLGRIFAAVGLNAKGASIQKLSGAGPFKVMVSHRADPKNPENKFAEIKRVTSL